MSSVELDSGLAAQQALAMQKATISMMKQANDAQKQMADVIAQTVTASNTGSSVDLYA